MRRLLPLLAAALLPFAACAPQGSSKGTAETGGVAPDIQGAMNTVPVAIPGVPAPAPAVEAGLRAALRNYPPLIVGGNVRPVTQAGSIVPLPCPAPGARVEQKGGPTLEYRGTSPTDGRLCRMRVAGQEFEAWYGIWLTAWPGAEVAAPALQRIFNGRTGEAVSFDVVIDGRHQWHDIIRHEGVEDINLLDNTYRTIKISHYREGFGGNIYRSVATVWKDVPTGMVVYATYQHISGAPVVDDPLIPTAIVPARTPSMPAPMPAAAPVP